MRRWLFIDTRSRETALFGWLDSQGVLKSHKVAHGAPGLMSSLARSIKLADLKSSQGICVVQGPGSFSSIRMGTLVANLLSRTSGRPLFAVDASEAGDYVALAESLIRREPSAYVAPVYDREPNITCPNV